MTQIKIQVISPQILVRNIRTDAIQQTKELSEIKKFRADSFDYG